MVKALLPRQQLFIAHRMAGLSGTDAAIAAGYSKSTAAKRAHELQHKNPAVMAALDSARLQLQARTNYNADRAMADYDRAIADARSANQHMAVMRGIEMKCRLNGLIREKVDLSVTEQMDIQGTLAEARARVRPQGVTDVEPRYPARLPQPLPMQDIFS